MDTVRKVELSDPDGWVGLVTASKELGLNRQTILTLAVKGDLEAMHIAGRTVISRASIDRVLAARTAQSARSPRAARATR